jgi:hypothetical protein
MNQVFHLIPRHPNLHHPYLPRSHLSDQSFTFCVVQRHPTKLIMQINNCTKSLSFSTVMPDFSSQSVQQEGERTIVLFGPTTLAYAL